METNQNNAIKNIRIAVESINSVIVKLNTFDDHFLNLAFKNPEHFNEAVSNLKASLNYSLKLLGNE